MSAVTAPAGARPTTAPTARVARETPPSVERRPILALDAGEIASWRRLAQRAAEPNPFFEPELLLPAARHLPGGDRAELLVVRRGARWIGCLAVRARPKWSDLWLPCVRTWRNLYSFLWTPLVDDEQRGAAIAAIASAVRLWRGRAFLAVEYAADGPVAGELLHAGAAGAAPFVHHRVTRAALTRRPDDTYIAEKVTGKRAREMRRRRRILERDLGTPAALRDVSGEPGAIDRFLAIESSGWKGAAGSALASDPRHERFFREVCDGFGEQGRMRLLELGPAGRACAMTFNLRSGAHIFTLKIGYDESFARGTPGIHLMAEMATWFHERTDATLVDSCAVPDHPMINELWPDRRALVSVVAPRAGLPGRVARRLDDRLRPRRERTDRR